MHIHIHIHIHNSKVMAARLVERGYTIATGGTDNHLVLWDLRPLGLTGSKLEKLCEYVHISLNKNAIHGDRSAAVPGGVRIGTPAMTSRGLSESDFETVADLLHECAELALEVRCRCSPPSADPAPTLPPASPTCAPSPPIAAPAPLRPQAGGFRQGGRGLQRGR